MKVQLQSAGGVRKEVKVGFSWTTFFFGFFVPLIRGDIKWSAIMFILSLLLGSFTMGIGAFISGIVFSFKYNGIYIKELLDKGYRAVTITDRELLQSRNIAAIPDEV